VAPHHARYHDNHPVYSEFPPLSQKAQFLRASGKEHEKPQAFLLWVSAREHVAAIG